MKKGNLIYRTGKTARDRKRGEAGKRLENRQARQSFHDTARSGKNFHWKDYPWATVHGKKNRTMRESFLKEKK